MAAAASCRSVDQRVQLTNDDSTLSKRSACLRGYITDDLWLRHFVAKADRRAPLINRGYYLRQLVVSALATRAATTAIHAFPSDDVTTGGAAVRVPAVQILSLGCGFDTFAARCHHEPWAQRALFLDIDFPDVIRNKSAVIRKNASHFPFVEVEQPATVHGEELADSAGVPESSVSPSSSTTGSTTSRKKTAVDLPTREEDNFHSARYHCIGCDLRTATATLVGTINAAFDRLPGDNQPPASALSEAPGAASTSPIPPMRFDPSVPTVIYFECVTQYIPPDATTALLRWLRIAFPTCVVFSYDQIVPTPENDDFGRAMLKSLAIRHSPLLGVEQTPSMATMQSRAESAGWSNVGVADFFDLSRLAIGGTVGEYQRLSHLEPFDEHEEWMEMCEHYCISRLFSSLDASSRWLAANDALAVVVGTPSPEQLQQDASRRGSKHGCETVAAAAAESGHLHPHDSIGRALMKSAFCDRLRPVASSRSAAGGGIRASGDNCSLSLQIEPLPHRAFSFRGWGHASVSVPFRGASGEVDTLIVTVGGFTAAHEGVQRRTHNVHIWSCHRAANVPSVIANGAHLTVTTAGCGVGSVAANGLPVGPTGGRMFHSMSQVSVDAVGGRYKLLVYGGRDGPQRVYDDMWVLCLHVVDETGLGGTVAVAWQPVTIDKSIVSNPPPPARFRHAACFMPHSATFESKSSALVVGNGGSRPLGSLFIFGGCDDLLRTRGDGWIAHLSHETSRPNDDDDGNGAPNDPSGPAPRGGGRDASYVNRLHPRNCPDRFTVQWAVAAAATPSPSSPPSSPCDDNLSMEAGGRPPSPRSSSCLTALFDDAGSWTGRRHSCGGSSYDMVLTGGLLGENREASSEVWHVRVQPPRGERGHHWDVKWTRLPCIGSAMSSTPSGRFSHAAVLLSAKEEAPTRSVLLVGGSRASPKHDDPVDAAIVTVHFSSGALQPLNPSSVSIQPLMVHRRRERDPCSHATSSLLPLSMTRHCLVPLYGNRDDDDDDDHMCVPPRRDEWLSTGGGFGAFSFGTIIQTPWCLRLRRRDGDDDQVPRWLASPRRRPSSSQSSQPRSFLLPTYRPVPIVMSEGDETVGVLTQKSWELAQRQGRPVVFKALNLGPCTRKWCDPDYLRNTEDPNFKVEVHVAKTSSTLDFLSKNFVIQTKHFKELVDHCFRPHPPNRPTLEVPADANEEPDVWYFRSVASTASISSVGATCDAQDRKKKLTRKEAITEIVDAALGATGPNEPDHILEAARQRLPVIVHPSRSNFFLQFPKLAQDVDIPEAILRHVALSNSTTPTPRLHQACFRINQAGMKLWAHYDVLDNVLLQVVGTKRVILFPPHMYEALYMQGSSSPINDVDTPDLQHYPRFLEAMLHGVACDLQPGDVLFIPNHWIHRVEASTACISINLFYDRLQKEAYDAGDVYGNRDPPDTLSFRDQLVREFLGAVAKGGVHTAPPSGTALCDWEFRLFAATQALADIRRTLSGGANFAS